MYIASGLFRHPQLDLGRGNAIVNPLACIDSGICIHRAPMVRQWRVECHLAFTILLDGLIATLFELEEYTLLP